jgi:hypothetical protein
VDRGERLNKTGDSWFSSKTIEVVPRVWPAGVEHCYGLGAAIGLPNHGKLRIPPELEHGRQSPGANVRGQEGNNPDRQLRSRISAKWKTRWEGLDSQEVGLEAAIL